MIYSTRQITMWLALGLALALAGCSSDDGSGTGGSGGSAGTGGSADTPLRILVTNDDGFQAEGIDAVVEGLIADPNNKVTVCAPDGNRSGSSDMTGPSERCGNLDVTTDTTLSGYPATIIDGCPADAVNYALENLYTPEEQPHVVISGINDVQNVSEPIVTGISGTVGAAKTAARSGVPALASSQGTPQPGGELDFPSGVEAVLQWLSENRAALAEGGITPTDVQNLNIPSCDGGSIRDTLVGIAMAPTIDGFQDPQDCESTLENPVNDVEALNNGFITQSSVPLN